jgi:hypothetical protein
MWGKHEDWTLLPCLSGLIVERGQGGLGICCSSHLGCSEAAYAVLYPMPDCKSGNERSGMMRYQHDPSTMQSTREMWYKVKSCMWLNLAML